MFQVYVKTFRVTIVLNVEFYYTVLDLKQMIENNYPSISVDDQKLIYRGTVLYDNEKTILDCNIEKESTIHLFAMLAGD